MLEFLVASGQLDVLVSVLATLPGGSQQHAPVLEPLLPAIAARCAGEVRPPPALAAAVVVFLPAFLPLLTSGTPGTSQLLFAAAAHDGALFSVWVAQTLAARGAAAGATAALLLRTRQAGRSLLHWAIESGQSACAFHLATAALADKSPEGAAALADALTAADPSTGESSLWLAAATGDAVLLSALLLALETAAGGQASAALIAAVLPPGRSLFCAATASAAGAAVQGGRLPPALQALHAFMQGDLMVLHGFAAEAPTTMPLLAAVRNTSPRGVVADAAACLTASSGPFGLTPLHIAALACDAALTAALCALGGPSLQPAALLTTPALPDVAENAALPPLPVPFTAPLSPLHLAIATRQPAVLETLCKAAAASSVPAGPSTAPPLLHWAAAVAPTQSPHADAAAEAAAAACAALLVAHGGDPQAPDALGWTAAAIAQFRNVPPALVAALAAAPAPAVASPPAWLSPQASTALTVPTSSSPDALTAPVAATGWECHVGLGLQAGSSGSRAFPALAVPLPATQAGLGLIPARLILRASQPSGTALLPIGSATVWLKPTSSAAGPVAVPAGADDAVVATADPSTCARAPSTTGAACEPWPAYLQPGPQDWLATAALDPASFSLQMELSLPSDVSASSQGGLAVALARVRRLACGIKASDLVRIGGAGVTSTSLAVGQIDPSASNSAGGSSSSTFFPGLVDLPASHTATVRAAVALRPAGVVPLLGPTGAVVAHAGLRLQFFSPRCPATGSSTAPAAAAVAAATTVSTAVVASTPAQPAVMAVRLCSPSSSSSAPAGAAPLTSPAACRASWTKPRVFGHRGSGADNAAAVVVGTPPGLPPPLGSPAATALAAAGLSRPTVMHVRPAPTPAAAPAASAAASSASLSSSPQRPRLAPCPPLPPLTGACAMASGPALGDGTEVGSALYSPTAGRRRRTHVSENTLLSFAAAGRAGAEYIEFDVQLTRDAVPVIHHDWGVKLPGPARIRVPLTHLTAEQFLSLRPQPMTNEAASDELEIARAADGAAALRGPLPPGVVDADGFHGDSAASWAPTPTQAYADSCGIASVGSALQLRDNRRRVAALGLEPGGGSSSSGAGAAPSPAAASSAPGGGSPPADSAASGAATMSVTVASPSPPPPSSSAAGSSGALSASRLAVDFQLGLRDRFCTFEEVLRGRGGIPSTLGYNVEVKYPTADETATFGLKPLERNAYIDRILDVVEACAGRRPLIFSSFDPDICVVLARKQTVYPVFLLTEALPSPLYADARWNSLASAVAFAQGVGLFGVVSDVRPLLHAPGVLIPRIQRGSGLVLVTYGRRNNDPAVVRAQMAAGIGAVIVDHVTHVCKSLKEGQAL